MKKEIDFSKAEDVGYRQMFLAHPIRFVIAMLIQLLGLKIFIEFINYGDFSLGAIVILVVQISILEFISWLAYGPINLNRLRHQNELKIVAEYVSGKKQDAKDSDVGNIKEDNVKPVVQYKPPQIWVPEGSINNHKYNKNFCENCGKELQENWRKCPYCGSEK